MPALPPSITPAARSAIPSVPGAPKRRAAASSPDTSSRASARRPMPRERDRGG